MSDAAGAEAQRADWYPDPLDAGSIRYWDGASWTSHTAPRPQQVSAAATPLFEEVLSPAAASSSPAAGDVSEPRRPRKGLIALIVVTGCLLLAIGGGLIAAKVLDSGPRSAVAAVKTYLDAVASGDASTANQLADPGVPEASRKLLTDEVLGAADARISVGDVTLIRQDDSSATVDAVLSLDGKGSTHRFTLRKESNDLLVLDNWALRDGLALPVQTTIAGPGTITVGSQQVSVGKQWIYPGVYTFHVTKSAYFEERSEKITVVPERGQTLDVTFDLTPTSALVDKVLAAVKDRVSACAGVPTNMDDMCPAAVRNTDLAALSVATQPSGLASLSADRFESEQAEIVTQSNSHASYTPPPRRTAFTLSGEISWQGGEPEISFDSQ
ncbi:DUF2510 domain-containing protein [Microbacterium xylanilyticum]